MTGNSGGWGVTHLCRWYKSPVQPYGGKRFLSGCSNGIYQCFGGSDKIVSLETWNWRLPPELQDVPWDCAAASLTWCLNTVGRNVTEADVVAGLGPSRISPQYGLLDSSGAGLVSYLAEIGIVADNLDPLSWQDCLNLAGHNPMLMGGRAWYHWTGVRVSGPTFGYPDLPICLLANPAPGWQGIDQSLQDWQFSALGSFSAVWFASW